MLNDKQISFHVKDTNLIECRRYPVSISNVHLVSGSQGNTPAPPAAWRFQLHPATAGSPVRTFLPGFTYCLDLPVASRHVVPTSDKTMYVSLWCHVCMWDVGMIPDIDICICIYIYLIDLYIRKSCKYPCF